MDAQLLTAIILWCQIAKPDVQAEKDCRQAFIKCVLGREAWRQSMCFVRDEADKKEVLR